MKRRKIFLSGLSISIYEGLWARSSQGPAHEIEPPHWRATGGFAVVVFRGAGSTPYVRDTVVIPYGRGLYSPHR